MLGSANPAGSAHGPNSPASGSGRIHASGSQRAGRGAGRSAVVPAPPKALIDRHVVLEIKALLSYSELPIGRIAERLCFEDASYLCSYFRRHTVQPLTGYRRAGQGGASGTPTAVSELRTADLR
nr:helix-turn-helix domain-containing protein [Stenotrophomonas sepilia]